MSKTLFLLLTMKNRKSFGTALFTKKFIKKDTKNYLTFIEIDYYFKFINFKKKFYNF